MSRKIKHPAIFVDRDGVIIKPVDYLNETDQVSLIPGVGEMIARINRARVPLVMVTNQSGIARGLLTELDLLNIHVRLQALLEDQGARIDAIYYCPHHPDIGDPPYRQKCACRKPAPGMLLQASQDLDIDLSRSAFIGDHATDIEAGYRAEVAYNFLVLTGYGQESAKILLGSRFSPTAIYPDVVSALKVAQTIICDKKMI